MRTTVTLTLSALFLCLTASAQNYELVKGQPLSSAVVSHEGYTVSFNGARKTPDWVAWELTASEASATDASRTDVFNPDPLIDGTPASSEYSRSGYDRGHMAPAADFKWSVKAMEESFYTSNICPQNNGLNAGLWCDLEKQCRTWAKHYGSLWIATGPVYSEPVKKTASGIAVPSAFFKVLLKEFRGRWYAIGFVMPNRDVPGPFFDWAVSVDEVERLTGLDFFSALPDSVEKAVEEVCVPDDWRYYMIPFKD